MTELPGCACTGRGLGPVASASIGETEKNLAAASVGAGRRGSVPAASARWRASPGSSRRGRRSPRLDREKAT